MTTTNTPSTKFTTNNDAAETVAASKRRLSPYAQFVVAFQGYCFFDIKRNKVLTKTQVYWRDPVLAMSMAVTNKVDKRYKLVNSPGWAYGTLNS